MPCAVSTFPADPELNTAAGPFNLIQSLVVQTRGSGYPAELGHNAAGRRSLGLYGQCLGEEAAVVPGGFPYCAAADGHPADYSLRATNGTRCIRYPYGAAARGTVNSDFTILVLFKIEAIDGDVFAPIFGACQGNRSNHGDSTSGPYNDLNAPGDVLGVLNYNSAGTYYLAACGGPQATGGVYYATDCVVTPGEWMVGMVSGTSRTGTGVDGVTTLRQFRRFGLHSWERNVRVSQTGPGVNQNIYVSGVAVANHAPLAWDWNHLAGSPAADLVVFPGKAQVTMGLANFVGHFKLGLVLNAVLDDSLKAFGLPAWAGGSDGFSWVIGYDAAGNPVAGGGLNALVTPTYTPGAAPPVTQVAVPSGPVGTPSGYRFTDLTEYTISGTAPAGYPAGSVWVANADAAVSRVTKSSIEITATRPAGAPAKPTSYSLTRSNAYPVAGTPLASSPVPIFTDTPPDKQVYYYKITATDGVNSYTYPPVWGCLLNYDTFRAAVGGNSVETKTGNDPMTKYGYLCLAHGFPYSCVNVAEDSTTQANWAWGSTRLNKLIARCAAEILVDGRPRDAVFLLLAGNSSVDVPTMSAIRDGLLAATAPGPDGSVVNLTRHFVMQACPAVFMGHQFPEIPPWLALQKSVCAQVADNVTSHYVGDEWARLSMNEAEEVRAGHPNWVMSFGMGLASGAEVFNKIIAPRAGVSRYRTAGV